MDEVSDVLIAPAVEEEPDTEAQVESNEGETETQPEEETADLKVGVDPAQPSAADVAEHRVTHMPATFGANTASQDVALANNGGATPAGSMTFPA